MNFTEDPTREIQFWVYAVGLPSIGVPGMVANLASVFVFYHRRMRSSFNILLGALSFFDSVLLLTACLLWGSVGVCYGRLKYSACEFLDSSVRLLFPVAIILQFLSVWICVAISVERYLAVRFPLRCRQWVSNKRTVLILLFIIVSGLIFCAPICFELQRNEDGHLVLSSFRFSTVYLIYRAYGHFIVMFVVPFTIMIILNVSVTISIRNAFKIQRRLMNSHGRAGSRLQLEPSISLLVEKERHATLTGISVSVTFLLLNVLASINNFLEALDVIKNSQRPVDSLEYLVRELCVIFGTFFVAVNSSVNFVVYCAIGNKFRNMFLHIYCGCIFKKPPAGTETTVFRTSRSLGDRRYALITRRTSATDVFCRTAVADLAKTDEMTVLSREVGGKRRLLSKNASAFWL